MGGGTTQAHVQPVWVDKAVWGWGRGEGGLHRHTSSPFGLTRRSGGGVGVRGGGWDYTGTRPARLG